MLNKKSITLVQKNAFTWWNVFGFVLIGLVVGSVIVSSSFIYNYLYRTLDEANSIVVLKSAPDIDEVDTALYNKAKALVDFKKSTSTPALAKRNIFTVVSTSTLFSTSTRENSR